MAPKPPSSLDYDGHLHELAVTNWRRAMIQEDVLRAEANALKLAASHDKFWRFIGGTHLAVARLGAGRISRALDALAAANRTYHDAPELASLAQTLRAHVYLETRSPRQALRVSGRAPALDYFRALAHARAGEQTEAEALRDDLDDPALAHHVTYSLDGNLDALVTAAPPPPSHVLASPFPAAPLQYEIAVALAQSDRADEALARYETILQTTDVLLHWPIPYVRSLYRVAVLEDARGETSEARALYARYVQFWRDGEIDRGEVAAARQFTSA